MGEVKKQGVFEEVRGRLACLFLERQKKYVVHPIPNVNLGQMGIQDIVTIEEPGTSEPDSTPVPDIDILFTAEEKSKLSEHIIVYTNLNQKSITTTKSESSLSCRPDAERMEEDNYTCSEAALSPTAVIYSTSSDEIGGQESPCSENIEIPVLTSSEKKDTLESPLSTEFETDTDGIGVQPSPRTLDAEADVVHPVVEELNEQAPNCIAVNYIGNHKILGSPDSDQQLGGMSTTSTAELNVTVDIEGSENDSPTLTAPEMFPVWFHWKNGGKDVFISGTFNDWSLLKMRNQEDGKFSACVYLTEGTYFYEYVVDTLVTYDPKVKTRREYGRKQNVLNVTKENFKERVMARPHLVNHHRMVVQGICFLMFCLILVGISIYRVITKVNSV